MPNYGPIPVDQYFRRNNGYKLSQGFFLCWAEDGDTAKHRRTHGRQMIAKSLRPNRPENAPDYAPQDFVPVQRYTPEEFAIIEASHKKAREAGQRLRREAEKGRAADKARWEKKRAALEKEGNRQAMKEAKARMRTEASRRKRQEARNRRVLWAERMWEEVKPRPLHLPTIQPGRIPGVSGANCPGFWVGLGCIVGGCRERNVEWVDGLGAYCGNHSSESVEIAQIIYGSHIKTVGE